MDLKLDDLEQDQQELIEKSDIQTLANFCLELQSYENEITELEQKINCLLYTSPSPRDS